MDSRLNMVLLCGLLLIASLQTTNAFRSRRSKSDSNQMLKTNIQSLQSHYKTDDPKWFGMSVFASHLTQLNSKASCTCQALLLERMLKIYEGIFQDMSNKSEKKEVKSMLNEVIAEVNKLKHKYNEEHKVWRELQDLHSIKVKNVTVQGGALNDFLMVFNQASTEKTHDKVQ